MFLGRSARHVIAEVRKSKRDRHAIPQFGLGNDREIRAPGLRVPTNLHSTTECTVRVSSASSVELATSAVKDSTQSKKRA